MFIVYNLKFHCDPYQNASCIFHRIRKNNPKICMEPQKTLNGQGYLKNNKAWDIILPDF